MNHILYNISLIILSFGIILLTVYITKASSNGFKTSDVILMEQQLERQRRGLTNEENIYDYRPSKVYKKMFSNPSVWLGYSDFDENEIKNKIYVKSS